MFKQLQEHTELDDSRGKNVVKQSSMAQFGLLNYGIRVRDPSQMFVFGDTNWVRGVSTENRSQQAGKSLMGSQCNGSVDHNLCNKEDGKSLGTEGFKNNNLSAKTENSDGFRSFSSHESAGLLTKNRSHQAGIFGKSLIGNECSGSVDHSLCNKDDSKSLGTKGFKNNNLFAKTENSDGFRSFSSHESAGLLTKNGSQQAGIFGKSLIGNEFSGSVDHSLCNKDDSKSLGTKGFKNKNLFAKTENSDGFRLIQSGSSSNLMQSAVAEASSSDEDNPSNRKLSHISQQKGHFSKPSRGPKSENDQVSNQNHMAWHIVSVKKEDGERQSTRPANTGLDAAKMVKDGQHNPSVAGSCELPSTSYAAKMVKDGQQKPAVHLQQLDVANQNMSSLKSKKEKVTANQDARSLKSKKRKVTANQDARSLKSKKRKVTANQDARSLKSKKRKVTANQNTCSLKSKKRKLSILERLPWHKQETEGSSRLHDISDAELKWARSVTRLPEKLKQLAEETTDSRWIINRKRRLSLTTKLMQMLFQPPPAIVLSEDAVTHCDVVTYYASKLALDDACCLCLPARKNMASKSSDEHDLLEVIEGLIGRSKRLEENVSRLEKKGSLIREVMMDFRNLERFSFINRFAKLHSTRPKVTGETQSSTTRQPYPQKCVKTQPMPETVPEGEDCLFL